ncbi:hypothetical protein FX984_04440 [Pseudomonas marginalis]|nr:hypothetical protein FX984_04440 [Pseudomonas marginalis]
MPVCQNPGNKKPESIIGLELARQAGKSGFPA